MKKSDLIKVLNNFEDDIEILVQGYECGYDNITNIVSKTVYPIDDHKWWNGEFADVDDIYEPIEPGSEKHNKSFSAIILLRKCDV